MIINLFDGISDDWSFKDLKGLQSYLDEVWQNRPLFLSEDDDEEEKRSTRQKFFNFEEDKIQPRNYIGFVQYNGLRLNVYPRVFHRHPEINAAENPSLVIGHVLKWLSYGNRIHFPFSETEMALQQQEDWLEALIYLFAIYTSEILTTSPYFAYQEVTEEMGFVRGRIAMQPYISQNLAKGRHYLLHCTYEPFLYDNQFNRIVKHTCRLLQSVTDSSLNKALLNDIIFLLDEVSDVYCTEADCQKVQVNRLYREVGIITNMCSAFLSNQSFSDGFLANNNLCILLPMEVIYEQYIAGFIKRHLPELESISQASDEYLALTGESFSHSVFQMKHDILIPVKLIIDTKYKFRQKADDKKAGVSQGDLYQMVAYCYRRNIKKGLLLYPKHFGDHVDNSSTTFKVGEILIKACTIDITENRFENFAGSQMEKVAIALKNEDEIIGTL